MRPAAPTPTPRGRLTSILFYVAVGLVGLSICVVSVARVVHHRSASREFGTPLASWASSSVIAHQPSPGRTLPTPRQTPGVPASPPTRIQIPALHVDSIIVRVTSVNGTLGVPEDPTSVGWWVGAAEPGSRSGSIVLDGHVDSATRGLGAFFHLTSLHSGDLITVTTIHGDQLSYRVRARHSYDKQTGLPSNLFGTDGPPRLVLITCGGSFDTGTLSYQDNIVVFATPAAR
jgi:hypothetical protein